MTRPTRTRTRTWARALSAACALALGAPAAHANPLGATPSLDAETLGAEVQARFGPQSLLGHNAEGQVVALRRLDLPRGEAAPIPFAEAFFRTHASLLGVSPALAAELSLTLLKDLTLPAGSGQVLHFTLSHAGIPFERRSATFRFAPSGALSEVRMDPLPARLSVPEDPITTDAARARAAAHLQTEQVGAATPVLYVLSGAEGRLAYRVPVAPAPLVAHYLVWIDAETGSVLATQRAGRDQDHLPTVRGQRTP